MDLYDLQTAKIINRVFYGLLLVAFFVTNFMGIDNGLLSLILLGMSLCIGFPLVPLLKEDDANGFHIFICNAAKFLGFAIVAFFTLAAGFGASSKLSFIVGISALSSLALTSVVMTTDNYDSWANGNDTTTIISDYGFIIGMVIFSLLYGLLSIKLPVLSVAAFFFVYLSLVCVYQNWAYSDEVWPKIKAIILLILLMIYCGFAVSTITIDSKLMQHPGQNYTFGQVFEIALYLYPFLAAALMVFFGVLGKIHEGLGDVGGFIVVWFLPLIALAIQIGILYAWYVVISIIGAIIVISIIASLLF